MVKGKDLKSVNDEILNDKFLKEQHSYRLHTLKTLGQFETNQQGHAVIGAGLAYAVLEAVGFILSGECEDTGADTLQEVVETLTDDDMLMAALLMVNIHSRSKPAIKIELTPKTAAKTLEDFRKLKGRDPRNLSKHFLEYTKMPISDTEGWQDWPSVSGETLQ